MERHTLWGMRPPGSALQLEQRRYRAIRLLKHGHTLSAAARQVGAAVSSVHRWQSSVERDGLKSLHRKPTPGRPAQLNAQQKEQLVAVLLQGPHAAGYRTELWTLKRIARLIQRHFGVRYHPGHVWKVLTQLGWSCQKPERRALARDEAAIRHWKRYIWPRIKKRLRGLGHTWFFSMKAAFC